ALYGTVILEFKAPGKLENKKEFEKAKKQVKEYIETEAVTSEYYGRYFGVIIDGFQIAFVRFRKGNWEETEALEINAQTILRLLEAIRGLKRKPIEAKFLLEDFGPESEVSRSTIITLYRALLNSKSPRTMVLFDDWKRVFSQVCAYSKEKLEGLTEYYNLKGKDIDVEKLMFSIHTYYTILMKLLTSEVVTLFADSLIGSYLKRLEEAYLKNKKNMLDELKELEEGGIFTQLGIKNFLEADYFAWYLDEWNDEIAFTIYNIVKKLLDYEPATVELSPERVKDLFKRLYQNLVPRDIRHKLGEYFTPDWLAELVLNEVGYDGNPDKRVLDPACGSGTFLVLVIKKIKEYAIEHFIDRRTLLEKIVKNVQGIDLNPLAVLASKANYIIALADLLRYRPKEGIEIPIYLADSIAVGRGTHLFEEEVYLKTVEGEFWIPQEILDKGLLSRILDDIEFCVRNKYSKDDFKVMIRKKYELKDYSINSLIKLYLRLLSLEKEGKNRIWTRILKNSFMPLLIEKFDYVVGNPPWINWENLPESYRNDTKIWWEKYGLLEKTKGTGLGKVKRDLAMLFVVRCFSQYVNKDGKLAFLIPFTTYKTQAGAGFRNWLANESQVEKIHDLVTLYPFEGTINRTSLIVISNGKTKFPIHCVMWHNPRSGGIDQEAELDEVKKITKRFEMILTPIKSRKPETPWMILSKKAYGAIQKALGSSNYRAYEGVNMGGLDGAYYIKILSIQQGAFIENLSDVGKKKVKKVKTIVEPELIYPIVRGREIKKWYSTYSSYVILPTSKSGKNLSEFEMKVNFPNTYHYLLEFKKELEKRSLYRLAGKDKIWYGLHVNIGEFTFAPYKVVWKNIAGKISGKAEFSAAVLTQTHDKFLGIKEIIPNVKLMLIPLHNEEEAHYICSVLNSSIVQLIVASYVIETGISTHITKNVYIPEYNPKNNLHSKLSELSKKAHELAKKYYEQNDLIAQEELKKVEEEIDKSVAELYGINDEELKEIKNCLMILKEGEITEEESNKEEIPITLHKKDIEIKIEPLLIEENIEKELTILIRNNTLQSIKNGNLKINLKSKNLLIKEIREVKPSSEVSFKFKIPKLKSGEHELKIEFSFDNKKIEETKKLFIKSKKSPQKETKGPLDEELEELLK
ncbi:MAG: N-6 DNA methylase, partial [Candidatus Aenigmatarchaeota archaeon]